MHRELQKNENSIFMHSSSTYQKVEELVEAKMDSSMHLRSTRKFDYIPKKNSDETFSSIFS